METIEIKSFSIVIVTFNSHNFIRSCVESIYNNINIPENEVEIIIIDNSNAKNHKILSDVLLNCPHRVILYHNSKNGGYGQGNNIGLRLAKAKYVCIVNPDVLFIKPIIKEALYQFKKDERLAMIGGKQFGGLNISFWIRPEYDFFLITAPLSILLNKLNLYFHRFYYLSGALLIVDKEKFEEIGLFDEEMFLYCEEADITKRFANANYHTKYVKEFQYKHLIDDRSEVSTGSFNALMQSTQKYLRKHNFSFANFLQRKIVSYNVLKFVYAIIGKSRKSDEAKSFLSKYKKLKQNL